MRRYLLVDFGSTFTKAVLVTEDGEVIGTAAHRTTIETDVMDGYAVVASKLAAYGPVDEVLACSSAGGGLRLAVVGYEREVSAQAGHRVALSSGAKVVHVAAGRLDGAGVAQVRVRRPDVLLLVGGTDGGNSEVLRHNALRLAKARVTAPIVLAGNVEASDDVRQILESTGRVVEVADNVLPRIGVIEPLGARAAIRAAFLRHVIGGTRLSRDPRFAAIVQGPTPDAMLTGVAVLADAVGDDVLVVDVGGATTDVYSVVAGAESRQRASVVAPLRESRTVEGDLGMRWGALGVIEAADRERLSVSPAARSYAARVASEVGHLPGDSGSDTAADWDLELELARLAALVAVRRHARPAMPSEQPRHLADVKLIVGSGGVLRHAPRGRGAEVLAAVSRDDAGGWRTPVGATVAIDTAYLLFAVGLLTDVAPDAARAMALTVAHPER